MKSDLNFFYSLGIEKELETDYIKLLFQTQGFDSDQKP